MQQGKKMNQNKRQRTKKEKKQTLGTEQNARFGKKKFPRVERLKAQTEQSPKVRNLTKGCIDLI